MSSADAVMAAAPRVRVREIRLDHLPNPKGPVLQRTRGSMGADPTQATCIPERVGWIAEVQCHPEAYALCVLVRPRTTPPGTGWLGRLSDSVRRFLGCRGLRPLYIELIDMGGPELSGSVVECALLGRLVEEAQRSWSSAPIVVPENNLAAQLFLRGAHYRAVGVLRDYFGDRDGYVMAPRAGLTR